MDEKEIIHKLNEKLEDNYDAYMRDLGGMESQELIDRAEEIAASKLVYGELKDGGYYMDYLEYLLRFENPLEVVRDQWIDEQNVAHDDEMMHVLWTISDKGDAERIYELDASFIKSDGDGGVKMC
jgi:hypothetical protein